jgi:hypothetical protein
LLALRSTSFQVSARGVAQSNERKKSAISPQTQFPELRGNVSDINEYALQAPGAGLQNDRRNWLLYTDGRLLSIANLQRDGLREEALASFIYGMGVRRNLRRRVHSKTLPIQERRSHCPDSRNAGGGRRSQVFPERIRRFPRGRAQRVFIYVESTGLYNIAPVLYIEYRSAAIIHFPRHGRASSFSFNLSACATFSGEMQ